MLKMFYFYCNFLYCVGFNLLFVFVQMVCECVSANEVGQSESLPLLQQLLNCVTAIVNAAATNCHFHSTALFSVLLRIAASRHALSLKFQVCK